MQEFIIVTVTCENIHGEMFSRNSYVTPTSVSPSNASIDSFLEAGPSAVHYLMAAADPEALRDTVMSRLAGATQQLQQAWKGYLHFTNDTAQLSTVLSQHWMIRGIEHL